MSIIFKGDKMDSNSGNEIKVFAGSASPELGKEIATVLGTELGKLDLKQFADGEIYVRILENVRGADTFVVQSLSDNANVHLMELLIIADAAKRSSVGRLTAVVPFYAYAKQDRQAAPREAISAKLVANLLTTAGFDRVLVIDLHALQLEGFFDIPVDHLYAGQLITEYIATKKLGDLVIVSPDMGGVKRARAYAKMLDAPLAIIDKRRPKHNESEVLNIVGEIEGKVAVLIDDEINTGGTIVSATKSLLEKGATEVYIGATHPVFAGKAVEKLRDSGAKEVIVTNSVNVPEEKRFDSLKVLSTAPLLGEAIKRIHKGESVSELVKGKTF